MRFGPDIPAQDIDVYWCCKLCDRIIHRNERTKPPVCNDCGIFLDELEPDVIASEKDLKRFLAEDHSDQYRKTILQRFLPMFREQSNPQYGRLVRIAEREITKVRP